MSPTRSERPDELSAMLRFLAAAAGTIVVVAVAAHRGAIVLCWAGLAANFWFAARACRQVARAAGRAHAAERRLARGMANLRRIDSELRGQSRRLTDSNRMLAELAATDELTRLANRRRLDATLARAVADADWGESPLSVLLLDVDQFKAYNDAFGHPAGDRVLRAVAERLRAAMRVGDVAGRYGGEEFLAVLPGTDADRANQVAERLRAAIEGESWAGRPVTVSLGVATVGPTIRGAATLVEAADRALYASKRQGRNRVTHADDLPPVPAAPQVGDDSRWAPSVLAAFRPVEMALT